MEFTGVKKEGRGFYVVYVNGEDEGHATNPAAAAAKLEKQIARFEMNAQRDASMAAYMTQRAEVEYSRIERLGMVTA